MSTEDTEWKLLEKRLKHQKEWEQQRKWELQNNPIYDSMSDEEDEYYYEEEYEYD